MSELQLEFLEHPDGGPWVGAGFRIVDEAGSEIVLEYLHGAAEFAKLLELPVEIQEAIEDCGQDWLAESLKFKPSQFEHWKTTANKAGKEIYEIFSTAQRLDALGPATNLRIVSVPFYVGGSLISGIQACLQMDEQGLTAPSIVLMADVRGGIDARAAELGIPSDPAQIRAAAGVRPIGPKEPAPRMVMQALAAKEIGKAVFLMDAASGFWPSGLPIRSNDDPHELLQAALGIRAGGGLVDGGNLSRLGRVLLETFSDAYGALLFMARHQFSGEAEGIIRNIYSERLLAAQTALGTASGHHGPIINPHALRLILVHLGGLRVESRLSGKIRAIAGEAAFKAAAIGFNFDGHREPAPTQGSESAAWLFELLAEKGATRDAPEIRRYFQDSSPEPQSVSATDSRKENSARHRQELGSADPAPADNPWGGPASVREPLAGCSEGLLGAASEQPFRVPEEAPLSLESKSKSNVQAFAPQAGPLVISTASQPPTANQPPTAAPLFGNLGEYSDAPEPGMVGSKDEPATGLAALFQQAMSQGGGSKS